MSTQQERQQYVQQLADLETQVRESEVFRRWDAVQKSPADPALARTAREHLERDPTYRKWGTLKLKAEQEGGPIQAEVDALLTQRWNEQQARAKARQQEREAAEAARLRAEQESRARDGLGGRVVTAQPLGDVPDTPAEKARRLETARSWAPADLAAQIKSIEPNRILGIPWGLKITLHNHDVLRVTNRSMRHGATEAAVRLSAALSRELGWRGHVLGGNPACVRRTAVILAAEGIHVRGRTPADKRLVRDALAEAGLANPPLPRRRPESAKRQQAREKMTDELLTRWTSPVQTTTPGAAPATPTGPGVSP